MPRKDIPRPGKIPEAPHKLGAWAIHPKAKKPRRRPPGSAPALVEPPRGPLPLQGGAEAPLEFDA